MKNRSAKIFFFLFIVISACHSVDPKDNPGQTITMIEDTTISSLPEKIAHPIPSLINFEHTDCKHNNLKGEKILSKKLHSDTLSIKITTVRDCGTKYEGDFTLSGDTLDLIVKQLPIFLKHKNGKMDTIYQSQECYCLYKCSFVINNIDSFPKTITVNGHKFRGEWKGL